LLVLEEKEYEIICHVCESHTHIIIDNDEEPLYCPMCGAEAEVIELED
tara:strand:- start:665 stop:808 length:144 start_codon:yes stop_codon:yes gene_type:complete